MSRFMLWMASFLVWSSTAIAGTQNPFRVDATNAKLDAQGTGTVSVNVRVPKDHYLYRDMMSVQTQTVRFHPDGPKSASVVVAENDATHLAVGTPSFPPGFTKPDPADPSSTREQYDMDVVIDVPVTAAATAGTYTLEFAVEYQGCKKSLCWMPQSDVVESTVTVREKAQ